MKSFAIIFFIYLTLPLAVVTAEDCHFKYWEVIPLNKCTTYHLPDFTFTSAASPSERSENIRRFCSDFEVDSKYGKQRTGYCYTGEGDRTGPTFRLGDEKWSFAHPEKDKVYFADLNFQGCYNDTKATGIVFGIYGWSKAPNFIERSRPVENQLAKCER